MVELPIDTNKKDRDMKVRASVKPICMKCKVIRRRGVVRWAVHMGSAGGGCMGDAL